MDVGRDSLTHSTKLPDPGAFSNRMTQNPHQPRLHPQIPSLSPFLLHPPAGIQTTGKSTTAVSCPLCHHSSECSWAQAGSLLSLDRLFHAISPPGWKQPWEKAEGYLQSSLDTAPLSSSLKACICRAVVGFNPGLKAASCPTGNLTIQMVP